MVVYVCACGVSHCSPKNGQMRQYLMRVYAIA